jgi:hypothetical protein
MRADIRLSVAILVAVLTLGGCQGLPASLPIETGSPAYPPPPSASQAGVCRPHQRPPQCIGALGGTPRRGLG